MPSRRSLLRTLLPSLLLLAPPGAATAAPPTPFASTPPATTHTAAAPRRPEPQAAAPKPDARERMAKGAMEATAAHAQELRDKLQERLNGIAASVDGAMGYAVLDLQTGEQFGLNENRQFPTASTIKLGILYELFVQADKGIVQLDDPRTVPERARVGGSGLVNELTAPQLSLRDHAILMILISDNTSTNVLIDTLGLQNIQARMDALGLTHTKLRRRMMDTEAARRGDENVSTPAELVKLLTRFHTGEGLSAKSRTDALAILTKAKSTAMTRTLPAGTPIASKPGGLDGVRVDAGLVLLKHRPYIFVAMCTFLQNDEQGDRAIGEASRATFEYFDRIGAEGAYGRRIR